MFKVLIAEDEMLVRLGLKNSIAWEKYDMAVVADAVNGLEAWKLYQELQPDLILTDLNMPIMQGMELISKIREHDQKTRIIILTCIEEFDMVRRALVYNVSDYILKLTMTPEEIEQVLVKCMKELQATRDSRQTNLNVNQSILKEKLIHDYLFLNRYSAFEFMHYAEQYHIEFANQCQVLCLMELEGFEQLRFRFQDEHGKLVHMSMLNVLNEIVHTYGNGEAIHDVDERYLIILPFGEAIEPMVLEDKVRTILNQVGKAMSTYFNVTVTFAVSGLQANSLNMREQYKQCMDILKFGHLFEPGIIWNKGKDLNPRSNQQLMNSFRQLQQSCESLGETFRKKLEDVYDSLTGLNPPSRERCQQLFIQLLYFKLTIMHLTVDKWSDIVINLSIKIENSRTVLEMIAVLQAFINHLKDDQLFTKHLSKEVAAALEYIEEHYQDEITLANVGQYVELSPNYLTSLFRKELQMSLIEYVLQLRIEKAKQLLIGTHLKSYEISDQVGFSDHSYFSRTFKKMTGLNPKEFRKKWMPGWQEEHSHEET